MRDPALLRGVNRHADHVGAPPSASLFRRFLTRLASGAKRTFWGPPIRSSWSAMARGRGASGRVA